MYFSKFFSKYSFLYLVASDWVLDKLEGGKPAPEAGPLESIIPDPGGFVSMLVLDMDAYAEKKHINFSQVLQDSLTALYQQRQQV